MLVTQPAVGAAQPEWSMILLGLAAGAVAFVVGWWLLRWHRHPDRYGRQLTMTALRFSIDSGLRGVVRTYVPISWWLMAAGVGMSLSGAGLALVRWSVLPASSAIVFYVLGFVPPVLGLLLVGVAWLLGVPASMRLVPRDPTSQSDLVGQLVDRSASAERSARPGALVPVQSAPTEFVSQRTGSAQVFSITARSGTTGLERNELVEALHVVRWDELSHAYGTAGDVPALLYAVMVGTDPVRREAWWELWGNIHHQGTVYEATAWCSVYLAQLAADPGHPDRVNALAYLRAIALGDGRHAALTRDAVEEHLPRLLSGWQDEPELVRRALLLLVSAVPDRLRDYPGLTDQLPPELQPAWVELMSVGGRPGLLAMDADGDDLMNRQDELERWALAGWNEPAGD